MRPASRAVARFLLGPPGGESRPNYATAAVTSGLQEDRATLWSLPW